MEAVLGLDVGATKLSAAVFDEGEQCGQFRQPTPRESDGATISNAILATARHACQRAEIEPADLVAVGIGSMGPLDRERGVIVAPPNVSADHIPLRRPLVELTAGAPITLLNDGAAGAVGELFATERECDHLLYVTISSGIGAGVVIDGQLIHGRGGNAAEIGHIVVDPTGKLECGCGGNGHWEAYCSGRAIPAYYRSLAELHQHKPTLPVEDPGLDAATILNEADQDPVADELLVKIRAHNAIGMTAGIQAFAPSIVVVGGGVALGQYDTLVEPLSADVKSHLTDSPPVFERPVHGAASVLRGAAWAARHSSTIPDPY